MPPPLRRRVRPLLALVLALPAVLAGGPAGAAPDPGGGGSPPAAAAVWTAPLGGPLTVTRPFDPPEERFGPGHRGVDLAGAPGAPVRAAGDGVVVFAGLVAGRPVISIDHDGGLRTTYEPLAPSVPAGRRVARGTPVGTLAPGHPGCPVAACLHWGVRRGAAYLDPLLLLRPPRCDLAPMWHA